MKMRFNASSRTHNRRGGWSLVETMMVTGIGSLLFAAIATMSMFTARSFVAMGNYADLDQTSRNALDYMTREIRQTKALTAFSTTRIDFRDGDDGTLSYRYSPTDRELTRIKNGTNSMVLLEQCDFLDFNISQRNPTNDFHFIPASGVDTAKLIDVTWRCSRTILGARVNTESVQTAKIVIRN